jgi:hypothetical protein
VPPLDQVLDDAAQGRAEQVLQPLLVVAPAQLGGLAQGERLGLGGPGRPISVALQ